MNADERGLDGRRESSTGQESRATDDEGRATRPLAVPPYPRFYAFTLPRGVPPHLFPFHFFLVIFHLFPYTILIATPRTNDKRVGESRPFVRMRRRE